MIFAHPFVLLGLVVPAALAVWTWRRQAGRIVLPYDHRSAAGSGRGWKFFIDVASTFPAVLLAVAVVLVAGPQRYGEPQQKRLLTNIEFCLDVSGSMTAPLGDGSRYDAALAAADEFLGYRKGDAFGLTFFGSSVLHWVPLTTDVSAFRCAPPFMRPEQLPHWFGGTEIGKALRSCRRMLEAREEGDRMIVLITDGMSADLGGGADAELARELQKANIAVFAVIIGEQGVPDEVTTIASLTGGAAFTADDPAALRTIFQRIDSMKQAKLESSIGDTLDDFHPWCAAGLVTLLLQTLAAWGLRYTPW
ncbi:MAG: vWA domain-containing protein [Pirellulales bacterium]